MVTTEAVALGLKYFNMKNLKGRPHIDTKADMTMMLEMWAEGLRDIPSEVFVAACKSLSGELTFYPAFAEVRVRCVELMHGKAAQAMEVWADIKRKMTAVSHPYANPEDRAAALASIADPVAREAAEKFGWKEFGISVEGEESYHKGQFEKLFNSIRDRVKVVNEAERFGLPAPGSVNGLIGGMVKRIGEEVVK